MNHKFISIYYNFCEYESKTRLTKEFMKRYPDVHLIELAFGNKPFVINAKNTTQIRTEFKGFINNEIINQFLSGADSLTFIDSDLILFPNFFEKVIEKVNEYKDVPLFLQPFSTVQYLSNDPKEYCVPKMSAAKKYSLVHFNGHTGHIYTYNKVFIDQFKKLPTGLLLGGFDTFLWMCLRDDSTGINKLMKNEGILKEILLFKESCEGVKIDYIEGHISHCFHGNKNKRYHNRMELYDNIDQNIIENYFVSRDEDS